MLGHTHTHPHTHTGQIVGLEEPSVSLVTEQLGRVIIICELWLTLTLCGWSAMMGLHAATSSRWLQKRRMVGEGSLQEKYSSELWTEQYWDVVKAPRKPVFAEDEENRCKSYKRKKGRKQKDLILWGKCTKKEKPWQSNRGRKHETKRGERSKR